jgi:hypothetical protein
VFAVGEGPKSPFQLLRQFAEHWYGVLAGLTWNSYRNHASGFPFGSQMSLALLPGTMSFGRVIGFG